MTEIDIGRNSTTKLRRLSKKCIVVSFRAENAVKSEAQWLTTTSMWKVIGSDVHCEVKVKQSQRAGLVSKLSPVGGVIHSWRRLVFCGGRRRHGCVQIRRWSSAPGDSSGGPREKGGVRAGPRTWGAHPSPPSLGRRPKKLPSTDTMVQKTDERPPNGITGINHYEDCTYLEKSEIVASGTASAKKVPSILCYFFLCHLTLIFELRTVLSVPRYCPVLVAQEGSALWGDRAWDLRKKNRKKYWNRGDNKPWRCEQHVKKLRF